MQLYPTEKLKLALGQIMYFVLPDYVKIYFKVYLSSHMNPEYWDDVLLFAKAKLVVKPISSAITK